MHLSNTRMLLFPTAFDPAYGHFLFKHVISCVNRCPFPASPPVLACLSSIHAAFWRSFQTSRAA
ncbi:hypothetical protein AG1IA_09061 [Rhizoctonia solani AG-1 IA]|uniref:Uncharacterized protein n=1 Tax=Thanatephorus cucumeris (strain AG1-IA) TaxID=983506 RepID=L8WG23_THACA|nr:hypothetical protein AG1IA_09061 [Rhizoctonia solani AG-1 IA]